MSNTNITLTDRAANHVKNHLAKQHNSAGFRIGVKPTGCSGYQYVLETAESINDNDQIFESNGIKIIVDKQSLNYLAGTELDYVRDGLNESFQFNNPNVQDTCGCGESFTIAEEGK